MWCACRMRISDLGPCPDTVQHLVIWTAQGHFLQLGLNVICNRNVANNNAVMYNDTRNFGSYNFKIIASSTWTNGLTLFPTLTDYAILLSKYLGPWIIWLKYYRWHFKTSHEKFWIFKKINIGMCLLGNDETYCDIIVWILHMTLIFHSIGLN